MDDHKEYKPIGNDFLEQQFIDDLYNLAFNKEISFISPILKRNKINIKIQNRIIKKSLIRKLDDSEHEYSIMNVRSKKLEDVDFTTKTYNCLFYAGFSTLGEIMDIPKNRLMKVKNLGTQAYDEIKEKIDHLTMYDGKDLHSSVYACVTIIFTVDGNERTYNICSDGDKVDINILLNYLYDILCDRDKRGDNIFDTDISSNLKNYLILKGYFYLDDILDNSRSLIAEFKNTDLESFAAELSEFTQNPANQLYH